jgi:hypothetical protein
MHRPPLPSGSIPGIHFCKRPSRPQSHSAAGRIISMKNSIDTIGNRSLDLPVCSAVHQPLGYRMPLYIKYFQLLFTARCTHQNCVSVVHSEDEQEMPETCPGFEF